MHVFTDSKVALRDAVTRPSKRLSSWELLDLATLNRTLKAELARQETEPKKQQYEVDDLGRRLKPFLRGMPKSWSDQQSQRYFEADGHVQYTKKPPATPSAPPKFPLNSGT